MVEFGEWEHRQAGEAVLTLMMCRFGRKALSSQGEDKSVVTFLEFLTKSLGDGSVFTWGEVLKLMMVLTRKCWPTRFCAL